MTFTEQRKVYLDAIEVYLSNIVTSQKDIDSKLKDAMNYSLLAGGKRIRPQLLLEFSRVCGMDWHKALPFACALEMIHTYSLIHDDLPCMDNDDLRRGKPTNHKVFGEYMAVLAGDALLNAAYEVMVSTVSSAEKQQNAIEAMRIIANAAGAKGMVSGQVMDMSEKRLELDFIHKLQQLKTGALIKASVAAGIVLAGKKELLNDGIKIAENIGLAFQIKDDLLDIEGSAAELGKNIGVDEDKSTFPDVMGIENSKIYLHELTNEALDILDNFDDNAFLKEFVKELEYRRS